MASVWFIFTSKSSLSSVFFAQAGRRLQYSCFQAAVNNIHFHIGLFTVAVKDRCNFYIADQRFIHPKRIDSQMRIKSRRFCNCAQYHIAIKVPFQFNIGSFGQLVKGGHAEFLKLNFQLIGRIIRNKAVYLHFLPPFESSKPDTWVLPSSSLILTLSVNPPVLVLQYHIRWQKFKLGSGIACRIEPVRKDRVGWWRLYLPALC